MDWLNLLAAPGILKSLLQHHSSKASILWYSDFFIVHLSLPYMTTGKTIALTVQPFVGKVMSLLFNMLSRFVIALTFIFLLFLYFDFDFFIFIPIPCFAKYLPHVPTVPGIKVLSLFAIAWTI